MSEENVNTNDIGANDKNENPNQAENYTDDATVKGENMIPKSRFDQVNEQKRRAIEALSAVADQMAEDVPEDMRDIIPDLPAAEKITWLRNALKKGLFNKQVADGLDSKRPGGKPPLDFSNMTTEQIIARGYK